MREQSRVAHRVPRAASRRGFRQRRASVVLTLENLERRDVPSVTWPGLSNPASADGTNHTLDQRQDLGTVAPGAPLGVVGTITNAPGGGGEVDFYQFAVSGSAQVQISTLDHLGGSSLASVLTLYQADPSSPDGYQVIAQDDGSSHGGDASLTQTVTTGSYIVAVSGAGNRYFYPFLEGSGYPGSTGAYGLSIQAGPPGSPVSSPPVTPNAVADDTVATANNLGDISNGHLVQIAGILGGDPHDPASSYNLSDVDMYHFTIGTAGTYAFGAEVFAGRIGSPLDAALTLFQQTSSGLQFVASNGDSMNTTVGTDGNVPLFSDPALTVGLKQGDYYIAVSSGTDYVDPAGGLIAGVNVFDPTMSGSGQGGNSMGNYVLNLRVQQASHVPHVVSVSVANGSVLDAPPTAITVQFDAPMNVEQLTFNAYTQTFTTGIPEVFIAPSDLTGSTYYPRLTSYDPHTYQATFSLLDALPNGAYSFHLSGPGGLTDLAGQPLAPNDFSGDYVVHFSVAGPDRGTAGNTTLWTTTEPNDDLNHPQVIGPLFPDEVASIVTITRPAGLSPSAATDTTDYYQITLLQSQSYIFSLTPLVGLDPSVVPTVWSGGQQIPTFGFGTGAVNVSLDPGTYVIGVDWTGSGATDVSYQLQISMLGVPEIAPSLTTGPAPLLSVQLVSDVKATPGSPGTTTTAAPSAPTVALVGGGLAPAGLPPGASASEIFIALSDRPQGPAGGSAVAAATDPNGIPRVQGTSVTQLSLLPGALVSIHTLGLGGDDAIATAADGQVTASPSWKPLVAARFLEALWAADAFLPEINVTEVVSNLTGVIDSVYISWARKVAPADRGAAATPPATTESPTATDPVVAPGEEPDAPAVPAPADTVGQPEAPATTATEVVQVEKQSVAGRLSPWNMALAGLSVCALLLGPLHVLRTRRHRKGGPLSSPDM
jgi:hypothetical protein